MAAEWPTHKRKSSFKRSNRRRVIVVLNRVIVVLNKENNDGVRRCQ
jgi:hypothetical protein